jgi:hypothetical protein
MSISDQWKARIGDVVLADRRFKCGSAFLLSKKPDVNALCTLGEWNVEASPSCRYLVAKCTNDLAENNILETAYEACQKALDLWAFSRKVLAATEDASSEYLHWWRTKRTTVIRSYSVARSGVRASFSLKVVSRDKKGKVIPDRRPLPVYNDSLRFFRLSQVTDDLFDAFRNMYLCFERLMSYKFPPKKREKEGKWLKRAITEADSQYKLPNVYASAPGKLVDDIFTNIYKETRCKVFHAKDGLTILTPGATSSSKKVMDSLDKLSAIVIHLCRRILHISQPGGIVTDYLLQKMSDVSSISKEATIAVSDMTRDVSPSDTVDILSNFQLLSKPIIQIPDPNGRTASSVTALFSAKSLADLSEVNSYFLIGDSHILMGTRLEGTLRIKGLTTFQPCMGLSVNDLNRPRLYFSR